VPFEVLALDVKRGSGLKPEQAPAVGAMVTNAGAGTREMGSHESSCGLLVERGLRVDGGGDGVSVDAAVELELSSMGAKGGECGRP
jgi:hypothetical protein